MAHHYASPKPQIPYTIFADGAWITGWLIRTSETTWLVHAPLYSPMQLELKNGEFGTLGRRSPDFCRKLAEWIVAYYE